MQEKKIGELIAENREKKGLSQRQLAKAINISNAELSKIEPGEREVPNPKILRKLSKYIDLNYNDTDFEDKIINLPKNIKIVNVYGDNINITNLCNILENVKSNVEIKSNYQKEIDDEFLKRNTYQGFNRSILNMVKKICSENITKNDFVVGYHSGVIIDIYLDASRVFVVLMHDGIRQKFFDRGIRVIVYGLAFEVVFHAESQGFQIGIIDLVHGVPELLPNRPSELLG